MRRTWLLVFAWLAFWGAVSAQTPAPAAPADVSEWNAREILFHAVFFALIFGVPVLVVWLSYTDRDLAKGFDISALWRTDDGTKLDRLFVIVLGTWWVHTCAIVLWTLSRTALTADFVSYSGWAIPIIARMFIPHPPAPPAQPGGTP